ncbi:hypothetical protein [Pedobacter sp. N23S346]|uniref:hypothetical protein n=1 Tax=Pedobacter sp. N23S346 TaxID=3402750 RepID=UPI003AC25001
MNQPAVNQHIEWHQQLRSRLEDLKIECHFSLDQDFCLLSLGNGKFVVNLVSIKNSFPPDDLIELQEKHKSAEIKLVHLWEDVWLSRPLQVVARIESLLGLNIRIHGRKTKVEKITKPIADQFLDQNHLQGAVNSRYKFGLFEREDLVAVATFSALRSMNHTENYKSAELIRFAVKSGYSVTGGLSKLISHFSALQKPNDVMTYADRDWSSGEAYTTLGFSSTATIASQQFSLDQNFNRSLVKDATLAADAVVFNTGSLKFILKF